MKPALTWMFQFLFFVSCIFLQVERRIQTKQKSEYLWHTLPKRLFVFNSDWLWNAVGNNNDINRKHKIEILLRFEVQFQKTVTKMFTLVTCKSFISKHVQKQTVSCALLGAAAFLPGAIIRHLCALCAFLCSSA